MDVIRRLFVAAVVLVVILPAASHAQGLTGALTGTVKDPAGAVVPDAVVRISSTALMGGVRETASSAKGQWRFLFLPPGKYTLTVETAARFAVYHHQPVSVGGGETIELTVTLAMATVAETVNVAATSEVVPRTSGMETRFGADYIQSVPSRRYSMFSLINSTPGVSPTSPASGSVNSVSVFGSAVNENAFLIDGTNFTCPCQGVSRAEPIFDVIQELHVQSMGASVEFGNVQGGVFNVVTKQGGARYTGNLSYYGQSSGLTAQPVVAPVQRGTQTTSGYERVRYRDFTTSAGGPIKRDRLWFFGAYQYLRDYDSQPGADPAFPRTYEQDKFFGKLNWQFTNSLHMMQSYHQELWVNPTAATLSSPFETTQRVHATVPNMTFAHITHAMSNRTVWEARVGRFLLRQDSDPSSGNRTTPFHMDQLSGVSSGNAPQIGTLHLDRLTAKGVLHRYQPDWLGTDHEFRAGMQFERGAHRVMQIFPGGVRYIDNDKQPFQAIYKDPAIVGGVFLTPSVFASDTFNVTPRVKVDAGIRFDHSDAISPDLPVVSADGRETDAVNEGVGVLYRHNMWSPRFGVTAKLDGSGRTFLRASYGRFNQGVLTGELDPIHPGATPTTTMAYEAATGGYTRLVSVVDPQKNLAIDPHTQSPHTDEFSLAFDRELARNLRASTAYIRKRGSDFIGWVDTRGEYREETRILRDGTAIPVFQLTSKAADRRFVLTNPDTLFSAYDAFVVALDKRLSKGWQASGSYTYSRARGILVTSNGSAEEAQFSTIARPGFLTFGQDPNDLTNAEGRLPNDRPHVFRATSVVRLPWYGILLAGNLQHFSGKPWAATTQETLNQGSRRILLESRGTQRLSSQTLLDVRVSKSMTFGSANNVDLILDVLNLLNDSAAESLVSDNRFSTTTFGTPRTFIDPRRAMLGVRLNLGR